MLRYAYLFLAAGLVLAGILTGCQDRISTLGAQFYADTVGIHTLVRNDAGFMQFADTIHPLVNVNGVGVTLTDSTNLILIGRVAIGNENLESWGLIQFPSLDTATAKMVTGIRLLLKDFAYKYGDTTSTTVDFRVWTTYNKVFDATTSLSMSDLSPIPVDSIDTVFGDTADHILPLPLDTTLVKPLLTESFNAFVITPGPNMTNVRAFGALHNYSYDENSIPELQLILNNGDTIYRYPTLDFHLVKDNSTTPSGEFTLRASTGRRERVNLNLTRPTDTLHLDQFTSINNATLVLHLDPNNTRLATLADDTVGPNIVQLGLLDSADHPEGNGFLDLSDPTHTTYRFQVRTILETWLRNPSQNLGFELRSEFAYRTIGGELIGVEDNTLNRWTFYGPNCSDTSKRPYFILSYSKLR
ncbi:MAG TPA: hypothetical protein VFH95_06900 [Candidatus Kapabacteria bacterium]|nr:hypothetical protein [Candidatus Kapabacteria bacterium]